MIDFSDAYDYEPDEILMDIDSFTDDYTFSGEEYEEMSFETTREASEGFTILKNDVNSTEELFSL